MSTPRGVFISWAMPATSSPKAAILAELTTSAWAWESWRRAWFKVLVLPAQRALVPMQDAGLQLDKIAHGNHARVGPVFRRYDNVVKTVVHRAPGEAGLGGEKIEHGIENRGPGNRNDDIVLLIGRYPGRGPEDRPGHAGLPEHFFGEKGLAVAGAQGGREHLETNQADRDVFLVNLGGKIDALGEHLPMHLLDGLILIEGNPVMNVVRPFDKIPAAQGNRP